MLFPTVDVFLDGAKILQWKFKLWNKTAFLFFFWVLLRYYSFNTMNQSSNCKSNICGNTLCDILKQPTLFFPSFCCQLAAVQGFLMGQRADSRRCHCPVAKRHAARRLIKLLLKPVKTQVKASVSAREAFSAILSSFFVSSNLKEKKWTQHCCCVYDNLFSSRCYFNFALASLFFPPSKEQLGWPLAAKYKD